MLLGIFLLLSFVTIYPLQAIVFFFVQGPSSLYTSLVLVFQECLVITAIIGDLFIFPLPSLYLFDAILTTEGFEGFILQGERRRGPKITKFQKFSKFWLHDIPWFFICPWWLFQIMIVLGLNMIPLVGPILVVFVKAPTLGIKYHLRYFELKFSHQEKKKEFIYNNRGKYLGFGLAAAACESMPILGFFFKFTNIIGSCLWTCRLIEKELQVVQNQREKGCFN